MSLDVSLNGMRNSIGRMDVSAHNTAQVSRIDEQGDVQPDLAKERVEQVQAEKSFAFNARTAKVQNDMLGDLLDIVG